MDLSDLTPEQADALSKRLGPTLGYLTRLCDRMQKRAWRANDPAYLAAREAQDGLHELCVRLHYQSIGNPGRRRAVECRPMPPLKILYVEDHPESREAVERLLRHNGHDVRGAAGVNEALAAAALERFDVLICDITLSDGDGCDLLRQLRRTHPVLRAIAVTGCDPEDLREQCRVAGFSAFVTKPVSFSTLLSAVDATRNH